jgi:PAS domain S-box-containing protein
VNREFTRVFGYRSEEALGRKLHDLVVPDDERPGFDENISRIAATQRVDFEMVRRRKNGDRLDVSIVAAPVPLFGGQIGTFVVYRDITGRKEAEEELRRSEADLLKTQAELAHVTRVTTIGELATSIAHEVNQPIAGVVTNGSACLRWLARVKGESADLAEARQAVQRVIRDGTRAGEVIARIRTLLKKTETAKQPLDLNETIREVIVLTRSEINGKCVDLRLNLAPDLPPVLGDRVQLQQVMLNLILNGIDAMHTVKGRNRELTIETAVLADREALTTVRDSGVGLDPRTVEQISRLSTPQNRAVSEWGFRLAVPSRRAMADGFGPPQTMPAEPPFSSLFRRIHPILCLLCKPRPLVLALVVVVVPSS